MVGFLNLPIELLRNVLEQTVLTVGFTKAIKLRLVCGMGLSARLRLTILNEIEIFNNEIPVAMYNAKLLDIKHRCTWFVPTDSWLLADYIFRKISADNHDTDILAAAVHLVVRAIVIARPRDVETSQGDCIRILVRLLLGTWTLDQLFGI